jgi:hypothetical protein
MITPDEHSCSVAVDVAVVHMETVRHREVAGHKGCAGHEEEVVARMEVAGHIAVMVQLHMEDSDEAEVAEGDCTVLPVDRRVGVDHMRPDLVTVGTGHAEEGMVQPDIPADHPIEGMVDSAGPPGMLDKDDQP